MSADTDLLDEIVAEVARVQGVVVKRDDPIMAAVLANKAILERYLRQALGTIEMGIAQALARSMTQARQELAEHAQAQIAYVDEAMLKDREKFVAEHKAALEALDARLLARDAALAKLMADILQKARAQLAGEMAGAGEPRNRNRQERATLGAFALGIAVGVVALVGGAAVALGLIGGQ